MHLFYKMLKELFDHQKKRYKVHKTKKLLSLSDPEWAFGVVVEMFITHFVENELTNIFSMLQEGQSPLGLDRRSENNHQIPWHCQQWHEKVVTFPIIL